jgi:hypothetical protein
VPADTATECRASHSSFAAALDWSQSKDRWVCWNTGPISVLSLGDIQQRMSCATFGLRLLPRQCCSPRAHILITLEPRVWPNRHRVMHHRRTPLGRLPAMAHLPTTVRYNPVMGHRRTLMGHHLVTDHPPNSVRDHPIMGHRRTLMGRHLVMARTPSTVCHHARTSYHRTLMGPGPILAHNTGTVSHRSTVRRRALMSHRRTQFQGRSHAPMPAE